MRVAIGSDHAGFVLKESVKTQLARRRHRVVDLGTHGTEPVDYPDFTVVVGAAVRRGSADRGIVIRGSGAGGSIAANKIPRIRAGVCHDTYSARQGVEHDDMNVPVMGSRVIGEALAGELARAFLGAKFTSDERHRRRLAKVRAIETRHSPGAVSPQGKKARRREGGRP